MVEGYCESFLDTSHAPSCLEVEASSEPVLRQDGDHSQLTPCNLTSHRTWCQRIESSDILQDLGPIFGWRCRRTRPAGLEAIDTSEYGE